MKTHTRIKIPIKTVSESNTQDHWSKKYKRSSVQKKLVKYWLLHKNVGKNLALPCDVKIIRTGKRTLDDDNLVSALKSVRDAIADVLIPGLRPGQADSDPRITWTYAQQTGQEYYIEVEIYCHPARACLDATSVLPHLAIAH